MGVAAVVETTAVVAAACGHSSARRAAVRHDVQPTIAIPLKWPVAAPDEEASAAVSARARAAALRAQQLYARSSGSICSRARAPRQRGSTNAAEAGRQLRKQRCHNTSMAQPARFRDGNQGQQGWWKQGARSGSRPARGRIAEPTVKTVLSRTVL